MNTLTERQIQAQVSAIRRSLRNGAQHFALRASGDWSGPDRLVIDGVNHLVLPCVSDLQIREALLEASSEFRTPDRSGSAGAVFPASSD